MSSVQPERERLTKRVVDAAEKGSSERFVWDSDVAGFGLRVTPQGVKSFVVQYRMKGERNSRRYTIGRYGAWTVDQARDRCKELVRGIEAGEHPREAKQAAAAARAKAKADAVDREFSKIAERWLKAYGIDDQGKKRRAASLSTARGSIAKLRAKFDGRAIDTITKADVKALLADLPKAQAATRRNLFAYARILWGYAEELELLQANPFHSIKAPRPPAKRDRWLDDSEFAIFWVATRKQSYPFAPFFRLLALTGQRRSEIAGMLWQELDRDAREWRIPGTRTKNHRPHSIPLSDAAIAELDAIAPKAKWPVRGLVFTVTGRTAISGMSRAKRRLDAEMAVMAVKAKRAEIAPWRLHDLRRTVATGLQRLGVRFEVAEAVLNHISGARGGVAGIYQQHEWTTEKRAALDAWALHVAELIKPKLAAEEAASAGSSP